MLKTVRILSPQHHTLLVGQIKTQKYVDKQRFRIFRAEHESNNRKVRKSDYFKNRELLLSN